MGQLWQKVQGEFAEIIEWIDDRHNDRSDDRFVGPGGGAPGEATTPWPGGSIAMTMRSAWDPS